MSDISGVLTGKLASMIGGLLGGAAILTFIRPKTIGEAFLRGALSTGSAIIFSSPILYNLNMQLNWENEIMIGFFVGFMAYSILGMIANFLQKNQDKTIVEAVKDIKDITK